MQATSRAIAIALIVIIAATGWVSFRLLEPPAVVPASEGDKIFSAERALSFLKEVAKEPHPGGTPAHDVVRDYILNYCKQMELETNLMDQTGLAVSTTSISAGRAQNILARMKGTRAEKTILVMAHYDSQPNTPGAGDDGVGVAAMMEAIQLLKKEEPLANDILFLFTDLEECGMLGAEAFVSQYARLDSIALIINLEARGNAGVGFTFEFSKLNGWMMRQYSRAVERPYANSFAYEIYKMMPNYTDFTVFKETNISGFNTALINGYAYYHSMVDRVENLDPRSLQHLGDILTQSLQHFGNLPLDNTKDEDMIFFTPFGSLLLLYPVSMDIPLMAFAFFLWIVLVFLGNRKRRIKGDSLFAGMGLFIAFFILSGLLVWGLGQLILFVYPHYTNFYSNNFYNATDYLWSVAGVVMLCFVLLFKNVASKDALVSVLFGTVFMLLLIMVGIKLYLNTGAYLVYYPVIILLIVYLALFTWNVTRKDSPVLYGFAQAIVIIPALALWLPIAHTIYVVFSLAMPVGAVVLLAFCVPFLLPTLGFINSLGRVVAWIFPAALILTGLVLGHIHSVYTNRYPLQTELMYANDADSNVSFWISTQKKLDPWLAYYFQGTARENFDEFYPDRGDVFWKSEAPAQSFPKGKVEVVEDSLVDSKRHITLRVIPDSISRGFRIYFVDNVLPLAINDRLIDASLVGELRFIQFYASTPGGTTIELEMQPGEPLDIWVIEQRPGLPDNLLKVQLPEDFIYRPDYISNSTQVKYELKL
jgi:hypothetical protein